MSDNQNITFVRVYINLEYIVPAIESDIESAKSALLEDLDSAVKYDELHLAIDVESAPGATWDDVPSWLNDYDETLDDETEEDA